MLDRPKTHVFLAALLASTLGLLGVTAARPAPQEELKERVKKLEQALEAHRSVLKLQSEQLQELQERQDRVDRWLEAVPGAFAKLTQGLNRAREQGFTAAGANIPARETLLQSLEAMAAGLTPKNDDGAKGR